MLSRVYKELLSEPIPITKDTYHVSQAESTVLKNKSTLVKAHTQKAMHDHAVHIFDRSLIGMRYWNVHLLSELTPIIVLIVAPILIKDIHSSVS